MKGAAPRKWPLGEHSHLTAGVPEQDGCPRRAVNLRADQADESGKCFGGVGVVDQQGLGLRASRRCASREASVGRP
jgi:hypothetical protein